MKPHGSLMMARAMALGLALAMLLAASPAAVAQVGREPGYRKWVAGALGLAIGLTPALLATYDSETGGPCSSKSCVATAAAAAGGVLGFMIGRERDLAAMRRQASGPSLQLRSQSVYLELSGPQILASHEDGAVIASRDGLATLARDGSVHVKSGTVRGISSVVGLPERDAVLAATPGGLYAFGLRAGAPEGRQIVRDGGGTVRAVGPGAVVLGGGGLLRRLRVTGSGADVDAVEEARAEAVGLVTDIAFSSFTGVLWMLAGDRLVARTATQLREVGSLTLPGTGRTLSLSGGHALVTAGVSGLYLVDIGRPEAPRLLGEVKGVDFVFDAVLDENIAYVAAGAAGLFVIDVSDPEAPVTLGVGRRLGYVSAVAPAGNGMLYVLDPNGPRLHTVDPNGLRGSR